MVPVLMVKHFLNHMIAVDFSRQWLNFISQKVPNQAYMFRFCQYFDNFLERSSSVHVFAQLNRVLFAGLNNFCEHTVIRNLNKTLDHVVPKGVHHQFEELSNCLIED